MRKPAASLHKAGCRCAADRGAASPSFPWLQSPIPPTNTTTPHASSRGNRPILSRSIQKPCGCRSREMASPRTITLVALSFALGLFFVFMGTIKLTPRLSKDAYSEMVSLHLLATRWSSAIVLLDVDAGASQAGRMRGHDDLNDTRCRKRDI